MGMCQLDYISTRTCEFCKKEFSINRCASWAYKIKHKNEKTRIKYFCSWACQRAYEKKHNIKYNKIEDYLY